MLEILNDPPWDSNSRPRQYRLALHYPSPLPTALSRQPQKKDCSDSTDIGIGYTVHVIWRVLLYAAHPFRSQMKACRIQRIQVKLEKY